MPTVTVPTVPAAMLNLQPAMTFTLPPVIRSTQHGIVLKILAIPPKPLPAAVFKPQHTAVILKLLHAQTKKRTGICHKC